MPRLDRRRLIKAAGLATLPGVSAWWAPSALGREAIRVTTSGQALISHDICAADYPGFAEVNAELARGDVVFTDLETAIRTPESGEPTRQRAMFSHAAEPEVLDCLKLMGFNLLALANNHAWDLHTAGVLATRNVVQARGFGFAGTGHNITEATDAGLLELPGAVVALVAAATGRIRDGAAATADRAGVNEIRLLEDETLHPDDAQRNLAAITAAAAQADLVIAYHHNHEWGDDRARTKDWARAWAQACIDAGAHLFVAHGAPLLHGIEVYRERLICHNLGSLIFHSRTPVGHYPPEVWQSAIVHADFRDGVLGGLEIVPVSMNELGEGPEDEAEFFATRGRPVLAQGEEAAEILSRLAALSADLGTELAIREGRGFLAEG
ncbi:MAG: CapA family protein [Gammaproteobacteria bacterium]|nr:CapA family protein [Gammaproteobacteria bacterium]